MLLLPPPPEDDLDFFLGFFFSSQTHTGLKESQKPTGYVVSMYRRNIMERVERHELRIGGITNHLRTGSGTTARERAEQ
jgi:hypothetical protein